MRRLPTRRRFAILIAFLLLATMPDARSQESGQRLEGEISAEGFTRIKIALPDASAGPAATELAAEIIATTRADLEFSGFFDLIAPSLYRLVPSTEDGSIRHDDWTAIGADAVVTLVVRAEDGRVDVEARLHDNASRTMLFGRRYGGTIDLARRVAHQLSDDLVRQYTGRPGAAMTRIAFVSRHGDGKEVYLMDYDGRRIRRLTTTNTINLAPNWSPQGDELAFVSWRGRQPSVYLMTSEGELLTLRTVGGELSSAPAWSPDGRRLVYSSDAPGNTEIYALDRATGRNSRLTHNPAIDTSPAVSPNGREIAFTSDRTGSPQIYVMDADGLGARRVSWSGTYNDSATWSPSGAKLAFASRIEGRFDIVVLDLSTDRVTRLTRGDGNSENPKWSPDGRHLVFASDRAGTYDIYTMRSDGTDVRRLTRGGNCFTPDWSR